MPYALCLMSYASSNRSQMTGARFDSLPIHANTKKAIAEVMGYELMTLVQEQTLAHALTGVDMLAKAKTGTGKTYALCLMPLTVPYALCLMPLTRRRRAQARRWPF